MPNNNEWRKYYKDLRKSLRQWEKWKDDVEDYLESTTQEDGGPGSNPPSPPPPPPPMPPGGQ